MNTMFNDCIILAGGSGIRLWPASTQSRPKQFLGLPSQRGQSFFGAAIERALAVTANSVDGRIIIVAGKNHVNFIAGECAKYEVNERKRLALIPEPLARGTAPAIACALVYLNWVASGRERNTLVLTSDHIIEDLEKFRADSATAAAMAQADKLVVFGIQPKNLTTTYSYIETAEALTSPPDQSPRIQKQYESEVFNVTSFRGKPDINKARQFLAAKNFYWNSGMFAFSSKFMLCEFHRSAPEVILPYKKLMAPNENSYTSKNGLRILSDWNNLETACRNTKPISFEHAIAKNCKSTVMVKVGFSCTEITTWDEYARLSKNSNAEVYGTGGAAATCFVDSDIPVALCGVNDLLVVVRSGSDGGKPAVLISKKGETQHVREIIEEIKNKGRTELL